MTFPGEETARCPDLCPLITAASFLSSGGSDGAVLQLTGFRIRYIVRLDEALEPALPACAPQLAVILILGARDPADGANLVNWVERMSACREPIKPRCFHVVGDPASAIAVENQLCRHPYSERAGSHCRAWLVRRAKQAQKLEAPGHELLRLHALISRQVSTMLHGRCAGYRKQMARAYQKPVAIEAI